MLALLPVMLASFSNIYILYLVKSGSIILTDKIGTFIYYYLFFNETMQEDVQRVATVC